MILFIVMTTVVVVGLAAIALAHPPSPPEIVVWNDEAERRMLRDQRFGAGRW